MSTEQSVKEFSFISYFLFSHYSCDRCASAPFRWLQFKRPNDRRSQSLPHNSYCFYFRYSPAKRGGWYTQGGEGWDDDGYGWHGDMMMLALHLVVDRHFMIRIISLATVSLLWLGSSANFPPMCTKASLMVLDGCWICCINLYSSVVDKYRLFMELIHISKASDILSWRWIFIVDVFFAVIFLASSTALLFVVTCLHCATLAAVS